jgi:murein DD-endopeptidase MepM/ murein hydrolase activator NlpD
MRRILVIAALAASTIVAGMLPVPVSGAGPLSQSPAVAKPVEVRGGSRLTLPTLASDGLPSDISLSALSVYQGGALKLRVTNARSGSATVLGRTTPLVPDGGDVIGYAGIGTEDPPYAAAVTLDFVAADGQRQRQERWFTILKTQWTVDYIIVPPPNPNAPPPPPGLVDEQPRLDALYRGVSPRKWLNNWQSPLTPPPAGLIDCARAALGAFPCVSGYFGEQRSFDGGPVQGHHGGTDLAAKEGTPIYAANDGVVVLAERVLQRGNLVVIDHGGNVFSAYGHMTAFVVVNGDSVARGQLIGYVGSTGLSTGPHLHWEIAIGGFVVDGLRWLDGSQGF